MFVTRSHLSTCVELEQKDRARAREGLEPSHGDKEGLLSVVVFAYSFPPTYSYRIRTERRGRRISSQRFVSDSFFWFRSYPSDFTTVLQVNVEKM